MQQNSRTGIRLTTEQRLDWLRLTRSESVGPLTFRGLINKFGGAAAALDALPELAKKRGKGSLRIPSPGEAEKELAAIERMGARVICYGEPDYPALLRATDGAPPLITVLGRVDILHMPGVAIVGSRNASGVGCTFTQRLSKGLTQAGYAIISGLARGIDTRAHEAALDFGTVAVMAGGLSKPYPPENMDLFHKIAERGAIVCEMPLGWEARGRDFPRRNRIISGLAYGTVIVEAARRSGSLITARFANEQGREVFAVPGSPLDPRAEGTNDLIREGATLITSVDNITQVLDAIVRTPDLFADTLETQEGAPKYRSEPLWDELLGDDDGAEDPSAFQPSFAEGGLPELPQTAPVPDKPSQQLLDLLGPSPVDMDDLIRLSGIPFRVGQAQLLELEMQGAIERHTGNRIALKVPSS